MHDETPSSAWRSPIPWLLIVVAAAQIGFATRSYLNPWKGGGFGMFASVDRAEGRFLTVIATDADGRRFRVRLPERTAGMATVLQPAFLARTRMSPTQHKLTQIANAVLASDLIISETRTRPVPRRLRTSYHAEALAGLAATEATVDVDGSRRGQGLDIREVQAQVLRLAFDIKTDMVAFRPVGASVRVYARSRDVGMVR